MTDYTPSPQQTKEIPLTHGRVAIVDAADYERLGQWKWHAHKRRNVWYARRGIWQDSQKLIVLMHRFILEAKPNESVDHIDGDGLNNTRGNIRVCNHSENQRNRGVQRNNTSGYKGVTWNKRDKCWHARIQVDGRQRHLGTFASKEEAARVRDEAALLYHGEFANLNF